MQIERFFLPSPTPGNALEPIMEFNWGNALYNALAVNLLLTLAKAMLIIVLTVLVKRMGNMLIEHIFRKREAQGEIRDHRLDTLRSLICMIWKYTVLFVGIIFFLQHVFGFNALATIAAIGVSGVAIGLAAQGILRDILTGIFILAENQYAVGERVSIRDKTGVIEEMALRVTRLRGDDGELYIIPNGEVGTVTNYSRKGEKDAHALEGG